MKLNPNVAQEEVVTVQSITLRIKEIVLKDVMEGVDKRVTEAKIKIVIDSLSFNDRVLQLTTRRTLKNFARAIYFNHSVAMRKLGKAYEREMKAIEPSYKVDLSAGFNLIAEQARFREFIDNAPKGLPVIENYRERVASQVRQLALEPPIATRTRADGTKYTVSLRNLAEIRTRFNANNEDLQEFKDNDVDLVFTSSHADSSIRCQPYQGRLYSISGKTGRTPDGQTYTPLDTALAGPDGDGNGIISGYNCRHRLIPYQQGLRPPEEYSKAEIKRERTIDQRQRYLENRIRNIKGEERALRTIGETERADELNARWKQVDANYKSYSLRNGRAFYRWRTQVSRDELV
jgi:hypothetical protein